MDSFANELSRFWMPGRDVVEREDQESRDDEASRTQQALEELAERVTAARSVV